jgi:UDP-glucuronate 4-epimerase
MSTQQTVFITGIAGFIGFHVARRMVADGWTVIGLDNCNDYYDPALKCSRLEQLGESITFYKGDLEDKGLIDTIFATHKPRYVCHLAAQAGVRYSIDHPEEYVSSNIVGFLNILEACRTHMPEHLLYASSSSVYGNNTEVPFTTSDRVDKPASMYAVTKRTNELMAYCYHGLYNIPCTGLRFFTVYGPWGRPDMAYFKFAESILAGKPIDIYNHGNLSRDFTYIDDIVEGVVRIIGLSTLHSPLSTLPGLKPGAIYNIGNGAPVSLLEFVEILESELGVPATKNFVDMQPGDVEKTWADCQDLWELTGFKPETPLHDGLHRFVEWYRMYYGIGEV